MCLGENKPGLEIVGPVDRQAVLSHIQHDEKEQVVIHVRAVDSVQTQVPELSRHKANQHASLRLLIAASSKNILSEIIACLPSKDFGVVWKREIMSGSMSMRRSASRFVVVFNRNL